MAAVAAIRFIRDRHEIRDVRAIDFDYNALAFERFLRQLATSTTVRLAQAQSLCANVSMSTLFYDPRKEEAELQAVLLDVMTTSFADSTATCTALYIAAGGAKLGLDAVSGGGPGSYPALRLNTAACTAALSTRATEHGMALGVRAALSAAGGGPTRMPAPPASGGAGGASPLPKNGAGVLATPMTRIGIVKDPAVRQALGGALAATNCLATIPTDVYAAALGTGLPVILCFRQFKAGTECTTVQGPCPFPPPHAGGKQLWHINAAALPSLQKSIVWTASPK
jgi:hypothetical protein